MPPESPPPPSARPNLGNRLWQQLQPVLADGYRVTRMDRDAIQAVLARPLPWPWAAGILAVGGVAWGLGFHSWSAVLLRPGFLLLWLLFTTVLARREGGNAAFPELVRAFVLVAVLDTAAILGPVGQVVVVVGTLWWVVILAAMVEELHGLGDGLAIRASVKGLLGALAVLGLLGVVDARVRGEYRWGTQEGQQEAPARDRPSLD